MPVTGAVIELDAAAVRTAFDFETAMDQGEATLCNLVHEEVMLNGETKDATQALSGLARQMGAETKFPSIEAAGAINLLAMAGMDTYKIYDELPAILNMGAAGNLSIAESADIATGIILLKVINVNAFSISWWKNDLFMPYQDDEYFRVYPN